MSTKTRPPIRSITVLLADGRSMVIEGAALADPKGGCLMWNDFGVKKVLKGYYKDAGEPGKEKKVDDIWDGTTTPSAAELPAIMIKPICEPSGWP